jgi:lipoprotein-anchoring transpeptidase ErfK/SrfK
VPRRCGSRAIPTAWRCACRPVGCSSSSTNVSSWTPRVGVGGGFSQTQTGRYFVADLLRPPDPGGFYGPYALGLSAYSRVFTSFAGGDGQIGIHGTNAPEGVGSDVSHGCIRVRNGVIARLARLLPLGTPVSIRA